MLKVYGVWTRTGRERFPHQRLQRKLLVSDPGMHHGTCVTHRFAIPRWREKRSQHSRRMVISPFCVSGKRPVPYVYLIPGIALLKMQNPSFWRWPFVYSFKADGPNKTYFGSFHINIAKVLNDISRFCCDKFRLFKWTPGFGQYLLHNDLGFSLRTRYVSSRLRSTAISLRTKCDILLHYLSRTS